MTDSMFEGFPSQKKVARLLLSHGIKVVDGKAYCGDIELTDAAIGRAAKVDRRIVRSTLERISSTKGLDSVFSKAECMLSMENLAPEIGCSTLKIHPTDPRMSGILSDITAALYRNGLSIRQAIVDDGGDREESVLTVVIDGSIPPELIPELRSCRGVASIVLYAKDGSERSSDVLDGGAERQYLRGALHDRRCGVPDANDGVRSETLGLLHHALRGYPPGIGEHVGIGFQLPSHDGLETLREVAADVLGLYGVAFDDAQYLVVPAGNLLRGRDQHDTCTILSGFITCHDGLMRDGSHHNRNNRSNPFTTALRPGRDFNGLARGAENDQT